MKVPRATPQETIEALLDASGRSLLPLSYRFMQHRDDQDRGVPGPLAAFVTAHNNRGLHQYLLAHAAASGGQFDVTRDSRVWARALGLAADKASSRAAVSKGWAWLERLKLIRRGRRGRLARITLLSDDGLGDPYKHPFDQRPRQDYITLPRRRVPDCVREAAGNSLKIGKHAIAALLMKPVERGREKLFVIHMRTPMLQEN